MRGAFQDKGAWAQASIEDEIHHSRSEGDSGGEHAWRGALHPCIAQAAQGSKGVEHNTKDWEGTSRVGWDQRVVARQWILQKYHRAWRDGGSREDEEGDGRGARERASVKLGRRHKAKGGPGREREWEGAGARVVGLGAMVVAQRDRESAREMG